MATPITSQTTSNLNQQNPALNWKELTPPKPFQFVSWKTEPEPTLADGGVKLADVEKGMRTLGEMGKEPHPLIWFARSDDIAMSAATTNTGPDVATLTDPKNLENPQAQLRALRELELNHQSSGDFSAEQWQGMTAKYKALTKLTDTPGTVWTRDSTYAGLWAKGTERAIVEGKPLGREVLDQAAGLGVEAGAVGVGAVAAKGVAKAAVAGASKITREVLGRKALGADGAKSVQIIERENGKMISRSHVVEKNGEVLHQHQNHQGSHGGERQFPSEWTGTKHVNAPYENIPPSFPQDPVPKGRTF
jgi:hypothetical protein